MGLLSGATTGFGELGGTPGLTASVSLPTSSVITPRKVSPYAPTLSPTFSKGSDILKEETKT